MGDRNLPFNSAVEVVPTQTYDNTVPSIGNSSTLETLEEVFIPINDPVDLAQRLEGKEIFR